jgi:hypothetical protein
LKIGCIFIDTGALLVSIPSFQQSLLLVNMDTFLLATLLSTMALVFVMLDCIFFLIHMCYYIIAHYMQLIFIHPYQVERIQCTSQKR